MDWLYDAKHPKFWLVRTVGSSRHDAEGTVPSVGAYTSWYDFKFSAQRSGRSHQAGAGEEPAISVRYWSRDHATLRAFAIGGRRQTRT
jgi:hypothetical protein